MYQLQNQFFLLLTIKPFTMKKTSILLTMAIALTLTIPALASGGHDIYKKALQSLLSISRCQEREFYQLQQRSAGDI
jgi:hypothetical protein